VHCLLRLLAHRIPVVESGAGRFFFQAEDGIRYRNVTGVQTCALPISAGVVEGIASILAMQHSLVPPTINHTTVDENIDPSLNLTLNKAQAKEIKYAMSNTFGFGGHNACGLFKKYES